MLEKYDYFKSSEEDNAYFLNEVATATKTGVYSVNFEDKKFFIDSIGRSILNVPNNFNPTIEQAAELFFKNVEDGKQLLHTCMRGDFYECDIEMLSYDGQNIWMRFTGKPKYDSRGEVKGIRGIFTSIDKYVRERQEVQRHSRIIEAQNQRLLHFAHIVSHNLRSHSSNLELTLELFDDVVDDERSKVFFSYLDEISKNLSTTLKHLNEVVTVNSQSSRSQVINIREYVERLISAYERDLKRIDATVKLDFSALDHIEYVPAFFNSILDTLISNAIQYRSSSRPLQLSITTKLKKNKRLLVVKDNGRGMDLNKVGGKLFKMYENQDASSNSKGLGLFLLKNQVEALGGDVVVKSNLDKGSTFTIKF